MATIDNNQIMSELKNLQAQVRSFRDLLGSEGRHAAEVVRDRGSATLELASAKARDAAKYARDEAGSVASMAREHPTATSGALLAMGIVGGILGYLIAQSQAEERSSRWSWH